ncbi:hypothetical protein QYF36_018671 [Acer negundo]|nr:hypothetical protein QYF36_018671 [Acer negundo]
MKGIGGDPKGVILPISRDKDLQEREKLRIPVKKVNTRDPKGSVCFGLKGGKAQSFDDKTSCEKESLDNVIATSSIEINIGLIIVSNLRMDSSAMEVDSGSSKEGKAILSSFNLTASNKGKLGTGNIIGPKAGKWKRWAKDRVRTNEEPQTEV